MPKPKQEVKPVVKPVVKPTEQAEQAEQAKYKYFSNPVNSELSQLGFTTVVMGLGYFSGCSVAKDTKIEVPFLTANVELHAKLEKLHEDFKNEDEIEALQAQIHANNTRHLNGLTLAQIRTLKARAFDLLVEEMNNCDNLDTSHLQLVLGDLYLI